MTNFDRDTARAIGLGLSFIPKPRSKEKLIKDIRMQLYSTCRSLRLAYQFRDKEEEEGKPHIRIANPDYDETAVCREIENFIRHLVADINKIIEEIEKLDEKTLHETSRDQDYIYNGIEKIAKEKQLDVKGADKDVGTTINKKSNYIKDMKESHLDDETTFKLQGHVTDKHVLDIKSYIAQAFTSKLSKFIKINPQEKDSQEEHYQNKLYEFLQKRCHNDYIASELYGLIKIHKLSINELKNIFHVKLKYRPIVAAHSSIFTNLSIYFNKFFKGFTGQHPINITDTNHLIKEIEETQANLPADQKIIIIAADIETLYPKMTKELILKAIRHFWSRIVRHSEIKVEFTLEQTIELIDFMLSHNLISFNNHIYLQLKGVIMGDNAAPALAIMYLLYLEETKLQNYTNNNTLENQSTPKLFRRYIDDILLLLAVHKDSTKEQMKTAANDFIKIYNQLDDSINITHNTTIETHHTPFLDLNLFTNEDHTQITMSTFFKEFHKFQYLHFESYHHPSTHSAFIFGELDRYLTHSSNEEIYNITKALFKPRLERAGYPLDYIINHFNRHHYDPEYRQAKLNKKSTKTKPENPFDRNLGKGYLNKVHQVISIPSIKAISDQIIKENREEKIIMDDDNEMNGMYDEDKPTKVYPTRKIALKFPHHPFTIDVDLPAIIRSNPYFERIPDHLQDIVVSYKLSTSIKNHLVRANLHQSPLAALNTKTLAHFAAIQTDYLEYCVNKEIMQEWSEVEDI